jgi:hypothetical protein
MAILRFSLALIASALALTGVAKADNGQQVFNTLDLCERKFIQQVFKDNGFYTSTIDGLWGRGTALAASEFAADVSVGDSLRILAKASNCSPKDKLSTSNKSALMFCDKPNLSLAYDKLNPALSRQQKQKILEEILPSSVSFWDGWVETPNSRVEIHSQSKINHSTRYVFRVKAPDLTVQYEATHNPKSKALTVLINLGPQYKIIGPIKYKCNI